VVSKLAYLRRTAIIWSIVIVMIYDLRTTVCTKIIAVTRVKLRNNINGKIVKSNRPWNTIGACIFVLYCFCGFKFKYEYEHKNKYNLLFTVFFFFIWLCRLWFSLYYYYDYVVHKRPIYYNMCYVVCLKHCGPSKCFSTI